MPETADRVDPLGGTKWNSHAARSGKTRSYGHVRHANQFLAEFPDDFLYGCFGALPIFVWRMRFVRRFFLCELCVLCVRFFSEKSLTQRAQRKSKEGIGYR